MNAPVRELPNNIEGRMKKLCVIEGCGKLGAQRGWCSKHYTRWRRYGDPLGGSTEFGEPMRFYREVVLPYDGDECLTWPYARNKGYGLLWFDKKNQYVSRLVCQEAKGPPPTPDHDAAHSCGRGDKACVTKRHLRWATAKENCEDTVAHGRSLRGSKHPRAKITKEQAILVKQLKGSLKAREIAEQVGLSREGVASIHQSKSWGWL